MLVVDALVRVEGLTSPKGQPFNGRVGKVTAINDNYVEVSFAAGVKLKVTPERLSVVSDDVTLTAEQSALLPTSGSLGSAAAASPASSMAPVGAMEVRAPRRGWGWVGWK